METPEIQGLLPKLETKSARIQKEGMDVLWVFSLQDKRVLSRQSSWNRSQTMPK
jgi:hypothetical protein